MSKGHNDFPTHTKPLEHQVGGHTSGNVKYAFLECGDGTILKPLQDKGRGEREASFYRKVNDPSGSDPVLLGLRPLLPTFFGEIASPDEPNVSFIRLEDIAAGFQKPCILDIKMGSKTHDPLAKPEKIALEEAKYPPAKKIGFRLRGMRVYDSTTDTYQTMEKNFLRTYDENTIINGFKMFFSNGLGLRKDVIEQCLLKLRPIIDWFDYQKDIAFFSSSILLVYEGSNAPNATNRVLDGSHGKCKHNLDDPNDQSRTTTFIQDESISESNARYERDLVRMAMIDFTHAFPLYGECKDENYMLGLRCLTKYFQELLQ